MSRPARTPEGEAATEVILETFRANGRLLAAGDRLAAREGLTSARWQVLGALALAQRPLTVPQIGRRMGLTRQSVQASVDRLRRDHLVEACENPDHRRSPLIRLTERGSARYVAVQRRQAGWVNELAAGLKVKDLAVTAAVLRELGDRLDQNAPTGREDGEDDATPRDGRAGHVHAAAPRGRRPDRADKPVQRRAGGGRPAHGGVGR